MASWSRPTQTKSAISVGQLSVETDGSPILASYPIPLDVADVQSLVDSGGHVGIVTKMQESLLQFYSKEIFRFRREPALHLSLRTHPSLTANTLALNEGETKTAHSRQSCLRPMRIRTKPSLIFTVSNVTGGQFLVDGEPGDELYPGANRGGPGRVRT